MPTDSGSGVHSVGDRYAPRADAPAAIIVDIDGTVALATRRNVFDEARVELDEPNPAVIATVRALQAAGHAVVFCSGRTDGCRQTTLRWLQDHVGVPVAALHMRTQGDSRKDSIIKREIFDAHIRDQWRVVCVLDDRNQVVRMWRDMGLTVLQVADGDF